MPRPRHGRTEPRRPVGDRGYDSDLLRVHLLTCGVRLNCPYRRGRVNRPFDDLRRLRSYHERWIIGRTIAWFGAFRRLLIRLDGSSRMFLAFFQCAAALIVLGRL